MSFENPLENPFEKSAASLSASQSVSDSQSERFPYAALFARLGAELDARPGQRLELWWSEVETFACSHCGMSCRRPWQVRVSRSYVQQWAGPLAELTGLPVAQIFLPVNDPLDRQAWAHLGKKPGSDDCILYDEAGFCRMHRRWGAEAKPEMCRAYPFAGRQQPDYQVPALALSCTRAARMISEPQQLSYRFMPSGRPSRLQGVNLAPGRRLSRAAWLLWTGRLFDGLNTAGGFGAWLAGVATALSTLLALPAAELQPADLAALPLGASLSPLAPAAEAELLAWLAATLGPIPALEPLLAWCASAPPLQLTPEESVALENYLRAYWLRQLLLPAQLLRGELNLVQQMLLTGVQGSLLRLWALYLRDPGPLSLDHLAEAANQVSLLVARDHAPDARRSWSELGTDVCLQRLQALASWQTGQPQAS
ncbi:MAG: YkgJ family cysteine cluster protein [Candidatus Sericytochromatia bacterium]